MLSTGHVFGASCLPVRCGVVYNVVCHYVHILYVSVRIIFVQSRRYIELKCISFIDLKKNKSLSMHRIKYKDKQKLYVGSHTIYILF